MNARSVAAPAVPFAVPDITDAEIAAVTAVLRSGWITTGPVTHAFEGEFAEWCGRRHAVALNSCTAALHLGLEALGVRDGDEVLTSTITFTATAEVVEYLRARTRFLDVDPVTLNLTPATVGQAVDREYVHRNGQLVHRISGGRLAAIVPVHYAGQSCDMDGFTALSSQLGVPILDDAAHALPSDWRGRRVGSFPCTTAFSFYATKTLTTGEGGMLVTDDDEVAARVRLMALHGISRTAWNRYAANGKWFYEVEEAGYKYNLTDMASALGRVQLQRAAAMLAQRTAIARRYAESLADLPIDLPAVLDGSGHAWHLYPVRLRLAELSIDRAAFIEQLRDLGIGTSVHFIPLHTQPFYRRKYGYLPDDFPVAEAEYQRLISLPIYSAMTDAQVDAVIAAVRDVTTRSAR